jgi:ABC-2 type transport system permease protein
MKAWATLVRREFWENRVLWIAPVASAAFLIGSSIVLAIRADNFNPFGGSGRGRAPPWAAMANEQGAHQVFVMMFGSLILGVGVLALLLYALDCLYAERRDRSILFWKSLPVSDSQTVLSKALVACVVVPAGLFVLVVVTHLVSAVILSMGPVTGPPMRMTLQPGALLHAYAQMGELMVLYVLWWLPVIAYAMLASVLAPRSPIMVAVVPVVVLGWGERIVFDTSSVWRMLGLRLTGPHLDDRWTSIHLWAGVVVAALVILLVIRLRRWRDDS